MDKVGFCYVHPLDEASVRAVLDKCVRSAPGGAALVLIPEAEASNLPIVQAAARRASFPILGGVFPKLILDGRFVEKGAWFFRLDEAPPHAIVDDLSGPADVVAQRIAATVNPVLDSRLGPGEQGLSAPPAEPESLFMMVDATTPNTTSLLSALYLELGTAVQYLGVSAGSETFQPIPCVFDAERVCRGLLWFLASPDKKTLLMHDYSPASGASVATSAAGNRIASIDFRPAFEFYQAQVRQKYGIDLTRENFYKYAVELPFGIQLASGQMVVRMPVGLDEDGSIYCAGEVPEHALLTIVQAPTVGSNKTAEMLARRLSEQRVSPSMLMFYCAGRRLRLGAESDQDLVNLVALTGTTAAGAITLGEIGSVDGLYPVFHNGAFVCMGWGPDDT